MLLLYRTADQLRAERSFWRRAVCRAQLAAIGWPHWCHCALEWGDTEVQGGYLGDDPWLTTSGYSPEADRLALKARVRVKDHRLRMVLESRWSLARYMSDVLGFRRSNWPPGSCVSLCAGLLGIDGRFRTPDSLVRYLKEKGLASAFQPSKAAKHPSPSAARP